MSQFVFQFLPNSINNLINSYADEIKLTQIHRKNYLISELDTHILIWNRWTLNTRKNEATIILTRPLKRDTYRHSNTLCGEKTPADFPDFLDGETIMSYCRPPYVLFNGKEFQLNKKYL